jgi:hypothetical protein
MMKVKKLKVYCNYTPISMAPPLFSNKLEYNNVLVVFVIIGQLSSGYLSLIIT